MTDKNIWKSYVWHENKCFFVSTIWRDYDVCYEKIRGQETIVWEYDYDTGMRGKMVYQSSENNVHEVVCKSLLYKGLAEERE
jgi:hypothetical protein